MPDAPAQKKPFLALYRRYREPDCLRNAPDPLREGTETMTLTKLGQGVVQAPLNLRIRVADSLIRLTGNASITTYVTAGMCYDTVAFVRYLLGANITAAQLSQLNSQQWAPLFLNAGGTLWHGGPIPAGTAVIFRRRGAPFHAALAVAPWGGTIVRGVNGNVLGRSWCQDGDSNIGVGKGVMEPYPENQNTTFRYGSGSGDICDVWLSNL